MDIDERTARLAQTTSLTIAPWLFRPLLALLAEGEPVTVEELADATGRSSGEVRETLADISDVETDQQGRVVGYGLTLKPTPHRFEIGGRQLYTWCALDTLVFPAILARSARIESPCPSTGTPVRVEVGPDGVTSVKPDTAVVSLVLPSPGRQAGIRAAFCNQVHFFASPQAAEGWLEEHPGMTVLPVIEAQRLGQPLVAALLEGPNSGTSCC